LYVLKYTWPLILVIALVTGFGGCSGHLVKDAEETYPPVGGMIYVDGSPVHYMDRGHGFPIVMIHGVGSDLSGFYPHLVEPLSRDFRVILLDRPGHGYTPLAPDSTYMGPIEQAKFVEKFLDQIGINECVMLGHSWGGAVATAYTIQHPKQVKHLVLLAPYLVPFERKSDFMMAWAEKAFFKNFVIKTIAVPISRLIQPRMAKKSFWPDPVPDYYSTGKIMLPQRPVSLIAAARDLRSINQDLRLMRPDMDKINCPVMLFEGDSDRLIPPEPNIQLADHLGWKVRVFDDTGHPLHIVRAQEILDYLLDLKY